MRKNEIMVGNCGWAYFSPTKFIDNWYSKFDSRIAAYASMFDIVEVDSTFYKLPSEKTACKWYSQAISVNEKFEFVPKAPKTITHARFDKSSLDAFISIAKALHARKLLFQTPASFGFSSQNFKLAEQFFASLSSEFIAMWEPRGDWLAKGMAALKSIHDKGITIVTDPLREIPEFRQEFYYFRLHGFGKKMMYSYKFSDEELALLRNKIEKLNAKVDVMFNNIYMYEDSLRFMKILSD